MELSQMQKDLLNLLLNLKMDTEDIVLIMTACQEENQIIQMIQKIPKLQKTQNQIMQT